MITLFGFLGRFLTLCEDHCIGCIGCIGRFLILCETHCIGEVALKWERWDSAEYQSSVAKECSRARWLKCSGLRVPFHNISCLRRLVACPEVDFGPRETVCVCVVSPAILLQLYRIVSVSCTIQPLAVLGSGSAAYRRVRELDKREGVWLFRSLAVHSTFRTLRERVSG